MADRSVFQRPRNDSPSPRTAWGRAGGAKLLSWTFHDRTKKQNTPTLPSPIKGEGRLIATAGVLALTMYLAAPLPAHADGPGDLAAAQTALAANNYGEALRLTDHAIAAGDLAGSNLAQAHFLRAHALRATGETQAAVDAYIAALQLHPRLVEAFIGLGRALDDQGRFAAAEQAHLRAIFLRPDLPATYIARGDSYVLAGEYGRAIADYTRAIDLEPDNVAALAGLAVAQRGAQ